jgi:hypothetical protein
VSNLNSRMGHRRRRLRGIGGCHNCSNSMVWLWLLWLCSAAAVTTTTEQKLVRVVASGNRWTLEDSMIRVVAVKLDDASLPRLRFQPHDRQDAVVEPQPLYYLRRLENDEENTSVWNKKYVGARVKNWLYFCACLVVVTLSMVNIFTCCSWCCCARANEMVESRDRLDTLDSRNMDASSSSKDVDNHVHTSSCCYCCPLRMASRGGQGNGSDPQEQAPESAVEKKLVILTPNDASAVTRAAAAVLDNNLNDDQSTSHSATSGDVAETDDALVETTVVAAAAATDSRIAL